MIERFRQWRLERAKMSLADAQHQVAIWGDHFGISPSTRRSMEKKVERAERRVAKLSTND